MKLTVILRHVYKLLTVIRLHYICVYNLIILHHCITGLKIIFFFVSSCLLDSKF